MKKFTVYVLSVFVIVLLTSCVAYSAVHMTSSSMNKIELGMSKEQLTQILGSTYTIAEKRISTCSKLVYTLKMD